MTTLRPLGRTDVHVPPVVFGTSSLGNLYRVVPDDRKRALVAEILRHSPAPAVFDSAGKYGAGLALEQLGAALRGLGAAPDRVLISNKLGWRRVPLTGPEPTFEPGVWAGLAHDAACDLSPAGILRCHEQGDALLGAGWKADLVSVHDPDEFLAAAAGPDDRARRLEQVVGACRALAALKAAGRVRAVGLGAKDWRVIGEVAERVDLDWAMLACSLTVHRHPPGVRDLVARLHARGVGLINSAVFHAGFLTGGPWFDYRPADPGRDAALFAWRDRFLAVCARFAVAPADACVQFGFALPGVVAVALNTDKPERIARNVASVSTPIPAEFWTALKRGRLIADDYPLGG
jgi:D-threo-aldose 1-dehydrogenase